MEPYGNGIKDKKGLKMIDWISLDDEQPHINDEVLICDELNDFVTLGMIVSIDENDAPTFMVPNDAAIPIDANITHWMPKPYPARAYD